MDETVMVVDGATPAPATPAAAKPTDDTDRRVRDPTRVVAAIVALVLAIGAGIAWWTTRPSPGARIANAVFTLPDAPTDPPVGRWRLPLEADQSVEVAGDTVVVVTTPATADAPTRLVARDLGSGRETWRRTVPGDAVPYLVAPTGHLVLVARNQRMAQVDDAPVTRPTRMVALGATDGEPRFSRDMQFASTTARGGRALVVGTATPGSVRTCELVDTTTGATAWSTEATNCDWTDGGRVLAEDEDGWQLRDGDGAALADLSFVDARSPPPLVVRDLVVQMDGERLVATDLAGRPRWQRGLDAAPHDLVALPHGGVLALSYGQDGPELVAAFGPDGRPRDVGEGGAARGFFTLDGRSYQFTNDVDADSPMTIRLATYRLDADASRRSRVGEATGHFLEGPYLTRRGPLVARTDTDRPPRLELLRWPDLVAAWSVDLADDALSGGRPPVVRTSAHGLAVVDSTPTAGRVLRVYD